MVDQTKQELADQEKTLWSGTKKQSNVWTKKQKKYIKLSRKCPQNDTVLFRSRIELNFQK